MPRRLLSVIVCAASWTTLSPQAASLAVAAHVAEHHEGSHDTPRHGSGPALVWHGHAHTHAHAPDTPSHRHVLAVANAIPASSKLLPRPAGRAPLLSAIATLLGSPSAGWLRRPARAGIGPPARVAVRSVLRI